MAAGIINPITGRRFVRSWRIDELLTEARELYKEMEDRLGVQVWYDLPLVRTLFNRGEQNDWLARGGGDAGYAEYLDDHPELGNIPELTYPAFAYGGVRQTARIDLASLVAAYRARLLAQGRLRTEKLDYAELPPGYDRYIYCEGWRVRDNPYFAHLPRGGTKGEALLIRTEAPVLDCMFKHRVFLVPTGAYTYWVGASSANDFADDSPTSATAAYLEGRLREVLRVPFTVTDHLAAVRPTVRDRRMIIGGHPTRGELFIFNGLGTKGASLAPLGSKWLFEHLEYGAAILPDVASSRFE